MKLLCRPRWVSIVDLESFLQEICVNREFLSLTVVSSLTDIDVKAKSFLTVENFTALVMDQLACR